MPATVPRKIEYLDGLRGLAAMQVVLLHFMIGFLPRAAEHAWPPLRLLFDGHTAVYIFFLISGAVLTPSFARPGGFLAKIVRRIVRLGLPVAVAAVIAVVLLAVWPDAHRRAAELTGSAWLAADSSGAPTPAHLLREIGLDSMLLGYRETTLFTPLAERLPPMELSLDAPFWSLHLELYGSLLVLCLVTCRGYSVWTHRGAVLSAAVLFGTDPMFLFVLGHVLRPPSQDATTSARQLLGACLLLLGFALCATKDWSAVDALRQWLAHVQVVPPPNLFQFQSQLGAIALYFGVLTCPAVWWLLESSVCRYLGRLSFGIYLLHFPILFTLACQAFVLASAAVPYGVAVIATFILFLSLVLLAAAIFERCVDRPAIALSRRMGEIRLQHA